ncbi:Flp pilus assembly complex ATPase component TadA [Acidobacteria bacterium AH-259-D05]|nr:Flp pilus assembly complex ATPase component TadA [Acidobacteria bacterium AH-259-D05]
MKTAFDRSIEQVFRKRDVVSSQALERAICLADETDFSLAEALLRIGAIKESWLIAVIAKETGIPPIDLEKVEFEPRALQKLNEELARHYDALPVACLKDELTVAVANPFDIMQLDELSVVTESKIRPVVSSERAISAGIEQVYASSEEDEEAFNLTPSEDSDEPPVTRLVNQVILQGLLHSASDIHIEPFERTSRVRYRIDGQLVERRGFPRQMHTSIISRIKVMSQLDIAEKRVPQDGKFQMLHEGRRIDFRVSILPSIYGEKAVLRILDSQDLAVNMGQLGFEMDSLKIFREAINSSYGMILVTGPTGSGKSTTLYSAVREILSPTANFITVEDPVEYQVDRVVQVPVNLKRGLTFSSALRSILRQDPDVIMVGEIRDKETANIAVKAAVTGHLVISTLHTNDAASSIDRLVGMGVDPFMASSSLILVAAQRLLRKLCDHCRRPEKSVNEELLFRAGFREEEIVGLELYQPGSCFNCTNGYKGRFALLECFPIDEGIRTMIVERARVADIKKYAVEKLNMLTLRRAGLLNVLRGRTSLQEVLAVTLPDAPQPSSRKILYERPRLAK